MEAIKKIVMISGLGLALGGGFSTLFSGSFGPCVTLCSYYTCECRTCCQAPDGTYDCGPIFTDPTRECA